MRFDLNRRSQHQAAHQQAIEEGLARLGNPEIDGIVVWGWRNGQRYRQKGHQVLVLERGYIADRFKWSSLAWNGLNGRAEFPVYPDDGGARFRSMARLAPWNPRGEYVLLIGQVRGDAALQGRDLAQWYADAAKQSAAVYGLPVRFRAHPNEVRKGIRRQVPGTEPDRGSLADALAGAAVVVTWNSNTGVDAMLAGKPTVVSDPGAMAWPVAARSIGGACNPDREAWAHALAWKQWTLDEIRSGEALEGIVRGRPGANQWGGRDQGEAAQAA